MFLFRIDLSRARLRFGGTVLVFTLPLLVGSWLIRSHYVFDLKANSRTSAHQARALLEDMLDNAEQANREVLPLVNKSCEENKLVLRTKVALEPFLAFGQSGARWHYLLLLPAWHCERSR